MFVKSSVCLLIVPVVLFCVSIAMFVKQYKVLGALSILSFFVLFDECCGNFNDCFGNFCDKEITRYKAIECTDTEESY